MTTALRGPALHAALTRRGLSPLAHTLHKLAAFITEHDLPALPIGVHHDAGCITVDADSAGPLAESAVRQWAAALQLVVTEAPVEQAGRIAAVHYKAGGLVDGMSWTVQATVPVEGRWPQ